MRRENRELIVESLAVPYVSHNEDKMDIDTGENIPAAHEVLNEEQLNSMSMYLKFFLQQLKGLFFWVS